MGDNFYPSSGRSAYRAATGNGAPFQTVPATSLDGYDVNPRNRHPNASADVDVERASSHNQTEEGIIIRTELSLERNWARFTRKGKKNVGVVESLRAFALSNWRNSFIIFLPVAWVAHFLHWHASFTFVFCFLSIVPLEIAFDYGGEQMTHYCGQDLSDLIVITLNNVVEATLAIILLSKCHLKLLQSTIIGVVILHLLLVPGTAFIIGGARTISQDLHPHLTQLNHTLLTIGVLSLLLPAAIFSASNSPLSTAEVSSTGLLEDQTVFRLINDEIKETFLKMSRGLAIILLVVYIASRFYLHNPPGEEVKGLAYHPLAPEALREREKQLAETEPEVNQYVCIVILLVCIGLLATTAEWLVESIEPVRESGNIQEEWFGVILLPIVSFAADGFLAIAHFLRILRHRLQGHPVPVNPLAKGRSIDLSIQFTLFWMPFFVLLGWWLGKPLSLLFDFFEIAALLGAVFIVNYVTADAKTNWAEGFAMVAFYFMIALTTWFYKGQEEIGVLLSCQNVVNALLQPAGHSAEH